ncbi:MAG: hypothetical protein ABH840_01015 [Nanoarchaeota archaeon]
MNKKGGMSMAILLLVFGTLILCTYTLYSFNTRSKTFDDTFVVSQAIGSVYSGEKEINFYVQSIINTIDNPSDEADFINKFSEELDKYKVNGKLYPPELEQVKKQLIIENIVKDNGKFGIKLAILLSGSEKVDNVERYSVSYAYEKTFFIK